MFDQTNPPQAPPAQCCSPKRMPPHNRPPSLLHMVHQWSESPQFFLEIPELAMDVVFWLGKSSTNGGWKKLPSTGTYLVDIRESELQYNIIYIYISLITYHNIISCLIISMFKRMPPIRNRYNTKRFWVLLYLILLGRNWPILFSRNWHHLDLRAMWPMTRRNVTLLPLKSLLTPHQITVFYDFWCITLQ